MGGRAGLEVGERQGPAWVPFPVSPSLCLPLLFSAASAVQSKTTLGLWRRWHNKAEVSLLLQHSSLEQAGGLGRLSFSQGAGPWAASLALVAAGGTGSTACWGRLASRAALRWGTHEVLQPYMSFCLCFCSLASPKRRRQAGPVFSRSSLGEKEPGCPPPGSSGGPLGASLLQLSTLPWNSLPVFFISAATTTVTPLLCYILWLSNAAPLGPAGWGPAASAPP